MATKPPPAWNPNPRLREAARNKDVVKSTITVPKGNHPEVIVHFKRPLPCVIILVHGVNDVGEAYKHQAAGLCAGLNLRLGRDDIEPGDWDVPQSCGTAHEYSYARRTADQGRNPIIPFYWGYRPVDKATYEADKKRYEAELKSRGPAAESPYDAYFKDGSKDLRSGHENTDNFNNRLDKQFCKNGGVFANATTNLIDMWGPGANIMTVARFMSNHALPGAGNKGDYSHSIFDNPHHIYMINAAQRLANLILQIRTNPQTANDSINVVAHSQGTLITMLANFIVKNISKNRPADCVIFNHSPYSLVEPGIESWQRGLGLQQTRNARETTLTNFCELIAASKAPAPSIPKMAEYGFASLATLQKPGHGRDNHGKVYNYFCPDEHTVSLRSVQGVGWQGVPGHVMGKLGAAFKQRMFHDKAPVVCESTVAFPVVTLPFTSATAPIGESRSVNGEVLPIAFTFTIPVGCGLMGSSDYGVDEAARGSDTGRETIADPRGVQTHYNAMRDGPQVLSRAEVNDIQSRLRGQGKDVTLIDATKHAADTLQIFRYQTKEEMRVETATKKVDDSFHSAIVNNEDASKYVTAFDLAIGRCRSYDFCKTDGGEFWQGLLKLADWRLSIDPDDIAYRTRGILSKDVKFQMNRPPAIPGVKNETSGASFATKLNAETKRIVDEEKHHHPSYSSPTD